MTKTRPTCGEYRTLGEYRKAMYEWLRDNRLISSSYYYDEVSCRIIMPLSGGLKFSIAPETLAEEVE